MENYQGDLNDIILASNKGANSANEAYNAGMAPETIPGWHQPSYLSHGHPNFTSAINNHMENFGDPFCSMRDPLLDAIQGPNYSGYFNSSNSSNIIFSGGLEDNSTTTTTTTTTGSLSPTFTRTVLEEGGSMRPGDMYSQVLAISPEDMLSSAPPCDSTSMAASCGVIKHDFHGMESNSQYISNNCLVESTEMMQISSPRNIGGIKRRKNQAKKVVCIPAPTAANSRATGEVVPSDLWAWRKYGQKPIKGSPYPRGYYRCSSSKGCPARKQVERSRTDPNMLVITYTSEHNHPWPTQRNALAGSTRSHHQPSKHTSTSKTQTPSSSSSNTIKEDTTDDHYRHQHNNNGNERKCSSGDNNNNNGQMEEEEEEEEEDPLFNNAECSNDQSSEDFFAELGELDADSLSHMLLKPDHAGNVDSKSSDPFNNLLEWLSSEDQQDSKFM